ncbi:MAG: glycoside hydrolase family 18 [Muribaculaceae bacterium]|nr:glycoside hydrolase family 18 [Muribaculaceae bacterium]
MKISRLTFATIILALSSLCVQAQNLKICLSYCPYYASQLPDPAIVTHINYGFAELYVTDGVYNGFKLQGNESKFKEVVALKQQNPDIKICLSFSHTVSNSDNRQGGGFSALAANPDYRRQFAADCLAFLKKWGIDGIDIDWEFPGISWSGHASNPAVDTWNFTLLMKELRETLGNGYLLTFAGYVSDKMKTDGGTKYIDITAAMPYVDFVNIMTYDMDEAPHYQSAIDDLQSYSDCSRAVNAYATLGVPFEKMVLGIPFYLRRSFDGATTVIDYKNLLILAARNTNWVIGLWDDKAKSTYATYKGSFYGGYDDERSIAVKGEWANSLGLAGLMYWECSEDDSNYTLARAVWNAVTKNYNK